MLEIDFTMIPSLLALVGIIGVWAINGHVTKENDKDIEEMRHRLDNIEKEQLSTAEALARTYATREYVYNVFITRNEFEQNMAHLEEKLISEMKHLNENVERMAIAIEGQKL